MITRETINKALDYVARKHGIMNSSANSQVATPSAWPIWRQRTRTGGEFIHNYSAFKAKEMFSPYNIQKSLCGEVPTLAQAVEAYKYKDFITWMTGQLTNLCTYMGYANMPNSVQVEGIADQFLQKYPFLRVTEVMYYFECIKDGRYYEATIKLEPQALIKGVVKYLTDLNVMKERWGNVTEDFNDKKLNEICLHIVVEGGEENFDRYALALLFGYYYTSVAWKNWFIGQEQMAKDSRKWLANLLYFARNPEKMPEIDKEALKPWQQPLSEQQENLQKRYKYF